MASVARRPATDAVGSTPRGRGDGVGSVVGWYRAAVKIRNALLRAFFWLLLGTIALMAVLTFYQVRRTLQSEIAGSLQAGAAAALQRIDTFFFAQLENLRIWHRLEVMQDMRVGDVDKRLSGFLSELRTGQGNSYRVLFCADPEGRIVASSDPSMIGRPMPDFAAWQPLPRQAEDQQDDVLQIQPVRTGGGDTLTLRAPIGDAFGAGRLGDLYAMLDWQAVLDLLDDAAVGRRVAVLIDAEGRAIGASRQLRERSGLTRVNLNDWVTPAGAASEHDGGVFGLGSLLVGSASSSGYQHFSGLGWRMLMLEPTDQAYRPIWHLLWAMISVLLLTLVLALWTATRLAGRIASPIVALTEFTRRFRRGEVSRPPVGDTAIAEVGELGRAFGDMIQALEDSRDQVVRAGKLAVVGEMAAIMAHEVRTPLGILRSSAQLLARQPELGDKERELSGYIVSETDRLNRLVTALLECASPRPPDFRPHDLHEIAGKVFDLLAARADKKQVELIRDFAAADAWLDCDREQLTQVFLNLVLNALHFVPQRGRIAIHTREVGGTLRVQVCDDGPGVAADLRARVFDPFFSRREGGVGLGLTVVQQIVQVHHGEIQVAESEWGGACFDMGFERGHEGEGA